LSAKLNNQPFKLFELSNISKKSLPLLHVLSLSFGFVLGQCSLPVKTRGKRGNILHENCINLRVLTVTYHAHQLALHSKRKKDKQNISADLFWVLNKKFVNCSPFYKSFIRCRRKVSLVGANYCSTQDKLVITEVKYRTRFSIGKIGEKGEWSGVERGEN